VGAGKTAEMIATAMEGRRLGLHHKSLFVVPKHTIEQFAKEFMRIYPAANILVSRPQDFTPANRKKFCAKIAAGDLNAIVMSFSQFEKIPMSFERQEMMMEQQINEIMEAIEQSEDDGSFSTKQLVSMQKKLQLKLEKLRANDRKDDVVTFEELGVDKLFVDEAHYFKNAFMATKMSNVAGIGQSAS
jgi:N12 class adenine-specific DNA methylase